MKNYHDQMNDLHFTQTQKSAMVDDLLAASQTAPRRFPRRRTLMIAIAAALILAVTAGAAGILLSPGAVFASLFGSQATQTEIIDQIGHPIGASATADGITITADAIIGDPYHYAIAYTIQRDDGQAIPEGSQRLDDFLLPFTFDKAGIFEFSGRFFDADPSDPSIQYLETVSSDTPFEQGPVTARFENLSTYSWDSTTLIAQGPWELSFDFSYEDASISLPAGQRFLANGMEATLDAVTLSPLAVTVDYSFDHDVNWSFELDESIPFAVTLQDGTTVDMPTLGSRSGTENGKTLCQKDGTFEEIIPLDTIESVTIGDVTIHVTQK